MNEIIEQLNRVLYELDPASTFCGSEDGDVDEYWPIAEGAISEFLKGDSELESIICKLIHDHFLIEIKLDNPGRSAIHRISLNIHSRINKHHTTQELYVQDTI